MIVPNEIALIAMARELDQNALAQIYDMYSPGLHRYAYRLLGDQDMAEDCVAETFSRFLKILHARQGPENHLQAYLYCIAHNLITDTYRRHSPIEVELPEDMIEDESLKPETLFLQDSEKNKIRLALRSLTPNQQQVVTLRFLEGWSNEEVSVAIQKPVGAVKALQHRALASLHQFLSSEEKTDLNAFK